MKTMKRYEQVINEALRSLLITIRQMIRSTNLSAFLESISVLTESTFLRILRKDMPRTTPMNGVRME